MVRRTDIRLPDFKLPRVSLPALIAFGFCVIAVGIAYKSTGDNRLLMIAIPMLLALLIIPMIMTKLNENVATDVEEFHSDEAKLVKIKDINLSMVSEPVKVFGIVEKVSFRSLNRPRLDLRDNTGAIAVIMFTPLPEDIGVGDEVKVIGIVMRKYLLRGQSAVAGMSIAKINV